MKNLHFVILISSLFLTSSCQRWIADKYLKGRPSAEFMKSFADASPEFLQGWEDGCETGMAGGSNTFYKMFYRNNAMDGYKMTSSSEYKTAWGNAFWYCYRYDAVKAKSPIWSTMFGGHK